MAASAPEVHPTPESASLHNSKINARRRSELMIRVLAALLMAPAGAWVVLAGGWWLIGATGLCGALAAYEWVRMMGAHSSSTSVVAGFLLSGLAVASTIAGQVGFAYVFLIVCAGSLGALLVGRSFRLNIVDLLIGVFYVSLPFGAFIYLREFVFQGGWLLLSVMIVVWTTDIAAFLAGRGFGGPRLAPRGSPNKTWSGAIGAFLCAVIAGGVVARLSGQSVYVWLIVAGALSVVGQLGDMLESNFKRRFGVKDASGFIPGHGGVLDRLDSLMACVTLVAVAHFIWPAQVNSFLGA